MNIKTLINVTSCVMVSFLPLASNAITEASSGVNGMSFDAPECAYYREALVDISKGYVDPAYSLFVASHNRGCRLVAPYLADSYKFGSNGFPKDSAKYLTWAKFDALINPARAMEVSEYLSREGDLYGAREVLISNELPTGELLQMLSSLDAKLGFEEESFRNSYGAFRAGNKASAAYVAKRALTMGKAGEKYIIETVEKFPYEAGSEGLLAYCSIMDDKGTGVALLKRFAAAMLLRDLGDSRSEKIILDTQKRITSVGIPLLEQVASDRAYALQLLTDAYKE